ncbi:EF-hand domain-containing protein [Microtetraspora glauca]|uniref:EF-hand domain-containing protein n=1 Tax=Microtetraspora glauca TaxID=1996 RepID=A0ABV3GNP7_MICGL
MLNDLQQRKMAHLFALLDVDDDGAVDKMDYTASADRLVNAFGFAPGSTESRRVRERYARLWDEVTLPMDVNGDERVDLGEFTAGFDRFVTQPEEGYRTHVAPVADAFYDLMDTDGDGRITRTEYLRMAGSAFRMSEADGLIAFERLDLDANGSLSRQELHLANEQFFRSPDAHAHGNWLFGPLPPRI